LASIEIVPSSPYRSSILEPLPLICYFRHSKHIGKFPVERERRLSQRLSRACWRKLIKGKGRALEVRKKRLNTRSR